MLSNSQMEQGRGQVKDGGQHTAPETITRAAGAAAIAEGRRATEMQNGEGKNRSRKMGASSTMPMGGIGGTGTSTSSKTGAPSHDEIAARAFQIYCRKGRPEGRDTENWLEAEAELIRERGMAGRKKA